MELTVSGLVSEAKKREILRLARQICKKLGIKGLRINIVLGILRDCGEINLLNKGKYGKAGSDWHFQVWLDKTLSPAMTCETLGHECQHIRQFLDGRLEIRNGNLYFLGECMSGIPYSRQPFEWEAKKVGREMREIFKI